MNFSVEEVEHKKLIRCSNEKLDALISPELKSQFLLLSKSGNNNFILDLSNVKYCDSSGLSAILVGNRLAKENKGKLIIFGLNTAVEKIISISQLDTILNIAANEENALNI
jgi:anti-anti-sigma factor